MSKIYKRVRRLLLASIQASTYADTEILFDWHKVDARKISSISGVQCIVRGKDGVDQTMAGIDLLFATSHIPTPDDGVNVSVDAVPVTLGTTGAAVDTPGWFNNLCGLVEIAAGDFNDGDLVYLNIATKSGLDIPVNGDLYVAAIAKGTFDFRSTIQVNNPSNYAAGANAKITLDTLDATLAFAPGDLVHAVDDAVVGTVKTVDSATQITLTAPNTDAIANNDVLYNANPITLILSCESWGG